MDEIRKFAVGMGHMIEDEEGKWCYYEDIEPLILDVKKLVDIIVNSPPNTIIKGKIESMALNLGHYPEILNIKEGTNG